MKKILFTILILLFSEGALSQLLAKSGENFFKRIRFTETSDALSVKLVFANSGNLRYKTRFYERFIQLEVSPAFIEAKKTLETGNEILDNVQVYAFQPGVIRVRLYLNVDGTTFADNLMVRSEGKGLVLYLKKEARKIEKGVEERIVNALDREILTALSAASGEKGEVPSELSGPDPDPGPVPEEKKPVEAAVLQKPDKPVVSERETAKKPKTVPAGLAVALPEKHQKNAGREKQPAPDKELKKSIDYETGTLFSEFFKMAGALGIVLALIFFATAGAKKLLSRNSGFLGSSRLVRVISSTPIGVKKQITIVDVAGEVLVLGVAGDNISMLMKMESEDAVALLSSVKEAGKSRPFAGSRRVFGKKKREQRGFNVEVERAVKEQKLSERDELINDVAKSIREKIEVLKKA